MRLGFLASFLAHTCVIAGGILWLRIVPPTALPVGESMEVSLVALHAPRSGSGPLESGPGSDGAPSRLQTDAPSAALSENTKTIPERIEQKEHVPAAPARQQDRAVRQIQGQPQRQTQPAQTLAVSGTPEPGKGAANNGQGMASERTGHGGSGNGSLPSPLGGNVNRPPAYPELARQRGQEGQVVLLVHVDMRGNPTTVLVEASSEYALLDQAAVRAIRRWKFNPASRNGEAVPGTVRVPVTFRLQ